MAEDGSTSISFVMENEQWNSQDTVTVNLTVENAVAPPNSGPPGRNYVCVRVLGAQGLAASIAPASDVMRVAFGERGTTLLGFGITASTLGFLSQGILTAPRVYYAMARDGVFFCWTVGTLRERTRVPVVAIALQGAWAAVIALSGRYEQIINCVVSADFIWFGLTGVSLFVFRRRGERGAFATPGHPWTTGFFVAGCWLVVAAVVWQYPKDSLLGWGILLCGVPLYLLWRRGKSPTSARAGIG